MQSQEILLSKIEALTIERNQLLELVNSINKKTTEMSLLEILISGLPLKNQTTLCIDDDSPSHIIKTSKSVKEKNTPWLLEKLDALKEKDFLEDVDTIAYVVNTISPKGVLHLKKRYSYTTKKTVAYSIFQPTTTR